MIGKTDMMDVLLNACPSFAPRWQVFQDEWRAESNDLPLYLILAAFARHLVDMMERGETAQLSLIFEAVEQLHVEGDHYVQEAATVGLLEDLQNLNLHKTWYRSGAIPAVPRPNIRALVGSSL
jgi:hypothetical protein